METVKKKMVDETISRAHKLVLNNREELSLTGISRVNSANDSSISLEINGTNLVISGTQMQVVKLDIEGGIMEVLGIIDQIKYSNSSTRAAKSFLGRIFK